MELNGCVCACSSSIYVDGVAVIHDGNDKDEVNLTQFSLLRVLKSFLASTFLNRNPFNRTIENNMREQHALIRSPTLLRMHLRFTWCHGGIEAMEGKG